MYTPNPFILSQQGYIKMRRRKINQLSDLHKQNRNISYMSTGNINIYSKVTMEINPFEIIHSNSSAFGFRKNRYRLKFLTILSYDYSTIKDLYTIARVKYSLKNISKLKRKR